MQQQQQLTQRKLDALQTMQMGLQNLDMLARDQIEVKGSQIESLQLQIAVPQTSSSWVSFRFGVSHIFPCIRCVRCVCSNVFNTVAMHMKLNSVSRIFGCLSFCAG